MDNLNRKDENQLKSEIQLIANTGIQFVDFDFALDEKIVESDLNELKYKIKNDQKNVSIFGKKNHFVTHNIENYLEPKSYYSLSDYTQECKANFADFNDLSSIDIKEVFNCFANKNKDEHDWFPVPFFRQSDDSEFRYSALYWCRGYLKLVEEKGNEFYKYKLVLAFDTKTFSRKEDENIGGIIEKDVEDGSSVYSICTDFRMIERYCECINDDNNLAKNPIDLWLRKHMERLLQRTDDFNYNNLIKNCKYQAFYQALVYFLGSKQVVKIPRVKVKYFGPNTNDEINVDVVIDIGNSRTSVLLSERDKEIKSSLGDIAPFAMQDLTDPTIVYEQAFPSRIEFAFPTFFDEESYPIDRSLDLFQWPSMVRTGFEAEHLNWLLDGSEGVSGISSPKRYLWDDEPVQREWVINTKTCYSKKEKNSEQAMHSKVANFVTNDGSAICFDSDVYPVDQPLYSKQSTMTFMLEEIIAQIVCQINSVNYRNKRANKDSPRVISSLIFTVPPAMPKQEISRYENCIKSAVAIYWQTMGWAPSEEFNPQFYNKKQQQEDVFPKLPEILINWDEAICGQILYLYNEVCTNYLGDFKKYLNLVATKPENKITLATIDIGGGTSDLVINSYKLILPQKTIQPIIHFRESFKIAGDDILLKIVQEYVLNSLEKYALSVAKNKDCQKELEEKLVILFGHDNMVKSAVQSRTLRKQATMQLFVPIAIAILSEYEKYGSYTFEPSKVDNSSFKDILKRYDQIYTVSAEVKEYINSTISEVIGVDDYSVMDTVLKVNFDKIYRDFTTCQNFDICTKVFNFMGEVINRYNCDMVIVTGRPSRLPGVTDCFKNILNVAKSRVISLANYYMGTWNPFRSPNGNITDPKSTAVTGALILQSCKRANVENFYLQTGNIKIISCIKYLGKLSNDRAKLTDEDCFYHQMDLDKDDYLPKDNEVFYVPGTMTLGFRSMDIERWPASPLYQIEISDELANYINTDAKYAPKVTIARVKNESDNRKDGKFLKDELTLKIVEKPKIEDLDVEVGRDIIMRLCTMVGDGVNLEHWLDSGCVRTNTGR